MYVFCLISSFFNSFLAVEKLAFFFGFFCFKGDADFKEDPEFDAEFEAELEYELLTFVKLRADEVVFKILAAVEGLATVEGLAAVDDLEGEESLVSDEDLRILISI